MPPKLKLTAEQREARNKKILKKLKREWDLYHATKNPPEDNHDSTSHPSTSTADHHSEKNVDETTLEPSQTGNTKNNADVEIVDLTALSDDVIPTGNTQNNADKEIVDLTAMTDEDIDGKEQKEEVRPLPNNPSEFAKKIERNKKRINKAVEAVQAFLALSEDDNFEDRLTEAHAALTDFSLEEDRVSDNVHSAEEHVARDAPLAEQRTAKNVPATEQHRGNTEGRGTKLDEVVAICKKAIDEIRELCLENFILTKNDAAYTIQSEHRIEDDDSDTGEDDFATATGTIGGQKSQN